MKIPDETAGGARSPRSARTFTAYSAVLDKAPADMNAETALDNSRAAQAADVYARSAAQNARLRRRRHPAPCPPSPPTILDEPISRATTTSTRRWPSSPGGRLIANEATRKQQEPASAASRKDGEPAQGRTSMDERADRAAVRRARFDNIGAPDVVG